MSGPVLEGLCPHCLLGSALEVEADAAVTPSQAIVERSGSQAAFPRRFGDYELLAELAN